jgi:hypothetical protein
LAAFAGRAVKVLRLEAPGAPALVFDLAVLPER